MAFTQQGIKDFSAIKLTLASPEDILAWSHGEVTKPETINYRTQKPEKEGLFSEAIFGPTKDFECYCGKYRRIRYKGIICDKCGVEVTRSIVRRERMGHIQLAAPVSHIWFLRGIPSKMGMILGTSIKNLEKVIYFASYIVIEVDEEARERVIDEIEREYKAKVKNVSSKGAKRELKQLRDENVDELRRIKKHQIISEIDYYDLSLKYGEVFKAGIGAEAIKEVFSRIDLNEVRKEIEEGLEKTRSKTKIKKLNRRMRVVESIIRAGINPEWMLLTAIPVIPPELRPMVPLDGGRFATSDVNDLYRRVINRNNRLKKLLDLNAPEVIIRNEKRMLQEAVDALIDNTARRGQAATAAAGGRRRPLRSLADMLKGKQGRFRQNLLGKRVDYSGRSVIVVGPQLKLYQTGLPKRMALEIFKPFVINKLIYDKEVAPNIRSAGRLIEEETDDVWASLEEVIQDRAVLLNRAPTLHRLGVQAFKPTLIEGSAIQVHPLVCAAFNADFDGDQMAVHLPLSEAAQEEAHELMLASTNLRKPATGAPIVKPSQDMILGIYWLTGMDDKKEGEELKAYSSFNEAITAHDSGVLGLHDPILVRSTRTDNELVETCVGRCIFNLSLPKEIGFRNQQMTKKDLNKLSAEIIDKLSTEEAATALDKMKDFGFHYATLSGISWGMGDLRVPKEKPDLIKQGEKEVEELRGHFEEGLLTAAERKQRAVEIWTRTKNEIEKLVPQTLSEKNPIFSIFNSGSRGSMGQLVQMAGMKGLVANPSSEVIELPVISSFKEGFNVLEYFISTHGARKGLTDTALKTANAGYLTRRLVDVAQDVVIRHEDCDDSEGLVKYAKDEEKLGTTLGERIVGRVSLTTFRDKDDNLIIRKNDLITQEQADVVDAEGAEEFTVRSPITCKATFGLCRRCFGADLATSELIELGQAIGIITAQSIGEPATQLTMRTFHVGGVAGVADITQGLPRVEELFEARRPKGQAILSEVAGKVKEVLTQEDQKVIRIAVEVKGGKSAKGGSASGGKKDETPEKEYTAPGNAVVLVEEGDLVGKGTQLTEGSKELKEMLSLSGMHETADYMLKEISYIYSSQGAHIAEKYIEVIIRQMFSRVRIVDGGDTPLMPGAIVEKGKMVEANNRLKKSEQKAEFEQLLLGITKVSLTTESFLSAASFQETTKTLTNAAIEGKVDDLDGLKENVIIGRLIPAGTAYREPDIIEE